MNRRDFLRSCKHSRPRAFALPKDQAIICLGIGHRWLANV